jgi:hypothetical protein
MVARGVSTGTDVLNHNGRGETIYDPISVRPGTVTPSVNSFEEFESALAQVMGDRGRARFAFAIPATTMLRVVNSEKEERFYTILGNRAYKSHNIYLLSSSERSSALRSADEDTVSVYRGVVGDHPELFIDLTIADGKRSATDFLKSIQGLTSSNYKTELPKIKSSFGVLRNSAQFWPFVDNLHKWMVKNDSNAGRGIVYAGILDLSRYDLPLN